MTGPGGEARKFPCSNWLGKSDADGKTGGAPGPPLLPSCMQHLPRLALTTVRGNTFSLGVFFCSDQKLLMPIYCRLKDVMMLTNYQALCCALVFCKYIIF